MFGCVHCHKEWQKWHLLNQLQTPNSSYNDNIFKHLCKTINPNKSDMVHFLFFMPSKKQDKILVLINCVCLGVPQTSELSSSCSQLSSWLLHRKKHTCKTFQSIWVKIIDIQWIVLKLTEIVAHVFSTARVAKLKKFSVFLSMLRFSRNICYVCINTLRVYYFIIFVWSLWQYIQKNMRPINLHGRLWWNPLWLSRVNLHFACVIFGPGLVSYDNFFL